MPLQWAKWRNIEKLRDHGAKPIGFRTIWVWNDGNQIRLLLTIGITDLRNGNHRCSVGLKYKVETHRIKDIPENPWKGQKPNRVGIFGFNALCTQPIADTLFQPTGCGRVDVQVVRLPELIGMRRAKPKQMLPLRQCRYLIEVQIEPKRSVGEPVMPRNETFMHDAALIQAGALRGLDFEWRHGHGKNRFLSGTVPQELEFARWTHAFGSFNGQPH